MEDINYEALIALLPEQYRAPIMAALQLAGAVLAGLSVLVPLVEKLVRATPSKTDDAYFEKVSRVRAILSVFPRVVVPRLSQAPTKPAPAPARAAHEVSPEERETGKVQIQWPSAEKLAQLERTERNESLPPAEKD